MLGKPTQGSMIALKRVTRYLKGTRDFVNRLELNSEIDKCVLKLDGYSDSDWAGSTERKSHSSGVLFVDGAPLYSFSRRQSVIATSSGTAEFYAACATAEGMLLARDVLMFFGYRVEASLHVNSAVGSVDVRVSEKSNRWKCERCGYNKSSRQRQSHSRRSSHMTTVLTLVQRRSPQPH